MVQAYHWSCAFAAAVYGDLPAAYGAVGIHANIIENPNKKIAQKGKWLSEEFKALFTNMGARSSESSRTVLHISP